MTAGKWRTDVENLPKDGTTVVVAIRRVVDAYWDAELKCWVLARPLHIESLATVQRFKLKAGVQT